MNVKSRIFLIALVVFGITVHQIQSMEQTFSLENHITLKNGFYLFAAGISAYCLYEIIPVAVVKVREFYELVQKERIRLKKNEERRKKVYAKVEQWFDKPGVSVLDSLYKFKDAVARKLVVRMAATKVASWLP